MNSHSDNSDCLYPTLTSRITPFTIAILTAPQATAALPHCELLPPFRTTAITNHASLPCPALPRVVAHVITALPCPAALPCHSIVAHGLCIVGGYFCVLGWE